MAVSYRRKVLLIDFDPQANASFSLLRPARYFDYLEQGRSISACLTPQLRQGDPFAVVGTAPLETISVNDYTVLLRRWMVSGSAVAQLDMIPGSLDLMRLALNRLPPLAEQFLESRWEALVDSARDSYDCVVIDCHPAGSFFTRSALLAFDAVAIPVTTDGFAATGLGMMRSFIQQWAPAGGAQKYVVVFNDPNNAWDATIESSIRTDRRFVDKCLNVSVGYSTLFRKIAIKNRTAGEQPVPYRYRARSMISRVTAELVEKFQRMQVFDETWSV
ncbi:MAG: hypothetical protein CL694_08010 [Chloroflexi bacterium]|nr:hypothetical protein [Chloroflexota bacterium]